MIFEITLKGYKGNTDRTDHLVKWIDADSKSRVNDWLEQKGFSDIVQSVEETSLPDGLTTDDGIDVVLTHIGEFGKSTNNWREQSVLERIRHEMRRVWWYGDISYPACQTKSLGDYLALVGDGLGMAYFSDVSFEGECSFKLFEDKIGDTDLRKILEKNSENRVYNLETLLASVREYVDSINRRIGYNPEAVRGE